jgi:hypothetical protein
MMMMVVDPARRQAWTLPPGYLAFSAGGGSGGAAATFLSGNSSGTDDEQERDIERPSAN